MKFKEDIFFKEIQYNLAYCILGHANINSN